MNRALLAALLLVTVAPFLAAQADDSGSKVKVRRAVIEQDTVVLDLRIEPSWHIYAVNAEGTVGNATTVEVDRPFQIAGPINEPKPKHHKKDYTDPDTKEVIYTEEYESHEGDITIRVPVKGGSGGVVKGSLGVTACDANKCLQPGKVSFRAEAANGGGGDVVGTASRQVAPETRTASRPSSRKVVQNPKRLGKFAPEDPFKIVEVSYPDPITSRSFDVTIVAEIGEGYHVYGFKKEMTGVPTSFGVSRPKGGDPAVVLAVNGSPSGDPSSKHRQKPHEDYHYFEGRTTFTVPVEAYWSSGKPPEAASDVVPFTFRLEADYQTCTMDRCLLPATSEFELEATAAAGASGLPPGAPTARGGTDGTGAKSDVVDARVSVEPKTLEPNSSAVLIAKLRRTDGQPIIPGNAEPCITLSQGQNLFIDGPTTVTAEADGSVTLRVPIKVAEAPDGAVTVAGRASLGALSGDFEGQVDVMAPLLGFLLIAIGAAFGALLTPCVFPMIPVTMSFFTKQAETGLQHPAKLAIVYCVGIVVSFTAIGALFTAILSSSSAANEFAGHWITQLVITGLFVFFALSLLGMFDLSVPQPIMNMVERHTTKRIEVSKGSGGILIAVLMMGLLFAVTTFTCTAPFIGGLLAGAAASGYTRPILGMLAFSLALAVPFFFLALFPSQLKKLPKAGGWLNETKVVMGFIELAAAIKFLNGADLALGWGIITRNVNLAIWVVIFGLTGLYLIGVFRLPKDMPRQKTGVIALLIAMLFLTIAIYLTTGLNGKPLAKFVAGWLPPIEEEFSRAEQSSEGPPSSAGVPHAKTGWAHRFDDDYDAALSEARSHDLPLLVDFTGYTCANCRAVEETIFMNKNRELRGLLQKFVIASLHLDAGKAKDKNNELVKKFNQPNGMPNYIVLDPRTERVLNTWGWEGADRERWKPKLNDALERFKSLKR